MLGSPQKIVAAAADALMSSSMTGFYVATTYAINQRMDEILSRVNQVSTEKGFGILFSNFEKYTEEAKRDIIKKVVMPSAAEAINTVATRSVILWSGICLLASLVHILSAALCQQCLKHKEEKNEERLA